VDPGAVAGGPPRTAGYWVKWNRCTSGNARRRPTPMAVGARASGSWRTCSTEGRGRNRLDDVLDDHLIVRITSCEQAVEVLEQRPVTPTAALATFLGRRGTRPGPWRRSCCGAAQRWRGACLSEDVRDAMTRAETLLDRWTLTARSPWPPSDDQRGQRVRAFSWRAIWGPTTAATVVSPSCRRSRAGRAASAPRAPAEPPCDRRARCEDPQVPSRGLRAAPGEVVR